jgi:hypothetical protein
MIGERTPAMRLPRKFVAPPIVSAYDRAGGLFCQARKFSPIAASG